MLACRHMYKLCALQGVRSYNRGSEAPHRALPLSVCPAGCINSFAVSQSAPPLGACAAMSWQRVTCMPFRWGAGPQSRPLQPAGLDNYTICNPRALALRFSVQAARGPQACGSEGQALLGTAPALLTAKSALGTAVHCSSLADGQKPALGTAVHSSSLAVGQKWHS